MTGLGLIGLITVQLLIANGCKSAGIDYDSSKCEIARQFGADTVDLSKGEDPVELISSRERTWCRWRNNYSKYKNEPVSQAATICRQRGRIILVGVVGLELSGKLIFLKKELTFQIVFALTVEAVTMKTMSKKCVHLIGFVRWTEQRETVLDLMLSGDA